MDILIPCIFATPSLQVDFSLSGCSVSEAVLTEGKENKRSQQFLREHGPHRLIHNEAQASEVHGVKPGLRVLEPDTACIYSLIF